MCVFGQEAGRRTARIKERENKTVETLQKIALNTDSLITLLHIDFLIETLKDINEPEKAQTLENIEKRAGEEKQGALGYFKIYNKHKQITSQLLKPC